MEVFIRSLKVIYFNFDFNLKNLYSILQSFVILFKSKIVNLYFINFIDAKLIII
jgi:hypothetical protein